MNLEDIAMRAEALAEKIMTSPGVLDLPEDDLWREGREIMVRVSTHEAIYGDFERRPKKEKA